MQVFATIVAIFLASFGSPVSVMALLPECTQCTEQNVDCSRFVDRLNFKQVNETGYTFKSDPFPNATGVSVRYTYSAIPGKGLSVVFEANNTVHEDFKVSVIYPPEGLPRVNYLIHAASKCTGPGVYFNGGGGLYGMELYRKKKKAG